MLVLRDRALSANRLDGCQAADFHLLLRIGECLFSEGQRLFLHARVLVGVDQIPVHGLNLVHRGNDLQSEGHIRLFARILGDANETIVRGEAESLQQMLRNLELKTRIELWT